MDTIDPFDEITRHQDTERRVQDRRDLSDEQSGRETGRIARHLPDRSDRPESAEARRRKTRAFQDLLTRLLESDPVYADAYARADQTLSRAEALTETAIKFVRTKLAGLEDDHAALRAQARRLPDGTRVFRSKDGQVYDEHGRLLSEDLASGIVWHSDSPSYEAYLQSREALEAAEAELDLLVLYRIDVLGQWRDRMDDRDAPPSLKDLEALERDLLERAPSAIKLKLDDAFASMARESSHPSITEDTVLTASDAPSTSARSPEIEIPKL